jgi:hypothetical protein
VRGSFIALAGVTAGEGKIHLYSLAFMRNRLQIPVKGKRFGHNSDLFRELPGGCVGQRLAGLDDHRRAG